MAAPAASKNVQTKTARNQIVGKVYRQYASLHETADLEECTFCSGYATGGMPPDFSVSGLDELFSMMN